MLSKQVQSDGAAGRVSMTAEDCFVAVRVGFEPTEPVKVQRFSRPPDSTALAPHRAFSYRTMPCRRRRHNGVPEPLKQSCIKMLLWKSPRILVDTGVSNWCAAQYQSNRGAAVIGM